MKTLLTLLVLGLCAAAADAATVSLSDGSVVKGTIQSADANGMKLSTSNGILDIPASQIVQVDYSGDEPRLWPPGAQQPLPQQAQPQPQQQYQPQPQEQPVAEPAPQPYTPPGSGYNPRRRRRLRYVEPDDEEDYKQELTLDFGGAGPISDISLPATGGGPGSNGAPGVEVGFQYLYLTTPRLGIGLDFDYIGRGDAYSSGMFPGTETDTYGDTLLFLATMKYTLVDQGEARPYISLGAGIADNSVVVNARPLPGNAWADTMTDETRQLVSDNRWVPAAAVKLGMDFHVWGPYLVSLEVGWTGLANASYSATPAGQEQGISNVSGPLNIITGGVRWGWKF